MIRPLRYIIFMDLILRVSGVVETTFSSKLFSLQG